MQLFGLDNRKTLMNIESRYNWKRDISFKKSVAFYVRYPECYSFQLTKLLQGNFLFFLFISLGAIVIVVKMWNEIVACNFLSPIFHQQKSLILFVDALLKTIKHSYLKQSSIMKRNLLIMCVSLVHTRDEFPFA